MPVRSLELVLVNTPIGALGSGRGGGVELTLASLIQGLVRRDHRVTLVSAKGSTLPSGCSGVSLVEVEGVDQPSWQHADADSAVLIPRNGLLPALWEAALRYGNNADAVINFGYDWLPLWLTPWVQPRLFHLISMGDVAKVMREVRPLSPLPSVIPSAWLFIPTVRLQIFSFLEPPGWWAMALI